MAGRQGAAQVFTVFYVADRFAWTRAICVGFWLQASGFTQGLASSCAPDRPGAGHLSASAQVATRRAVSAPRSDNGVARSHATIWTARCRHQTRQRSVTLAG